MALEQPRGLGWRRDAPDVRDYSTRSLLAPRGVLPRTCLKLLPYVREVRNQGGTSSCVAHAFGSAVDTRLRAIGQDPPDNSRLALYAATRAYERAPVSETPAPLVDEGSYPRDCARALKNYGLLPEEEWPFDEQKVNVHPPWDIAQKASTFRVGSYHRVIEAPGKRSLEIQRACAQSYPCVFGAEVGESFLSFTAARGARTLAPLLVGKPVGGHMMTIVGYETDSAGRVYFRVLNSWGTSWGDEGYCWVAEEDLATEDATDFYVMEVAW